MMKASHISSPFGVRQPWLTLSAHRAAAESPDLRRRHRRLMERLFRHKPLAGERPTCSAWAICLEEVGRLQCGPTRFMWQVAAKNQGVRMRNPQLAERRVAVYSSSHRENADSPSDGFRPSSAQLSFCREVCAWTDQILP